MTRVQFLKFWSLGVGLMDALTGLALVVAPAALLKILQVPPPSPDALVFLSWIGIFVMAVGLSYGLALSTRGRGEAVWVFTSGVRALVAAFLTVKLLDESLAKPWAMVALTDGVVAIVQIVVLRAGWWREVHR